MKKISALLCLLSILPLSSCSGTVKNVTLNCEGTIYRFGEHTVKYTLSDTSVKFADKLLPEYFPVDKLGGKQIKTIQRLSDSQIQVTYDGNETSALSDSTILFKVDSRAFIAGANDTVDAFASANYALNCASSTNISQSSDSELINSFKLLGATINSNKLPNTSSKEFKSVDEAETEGFVFSNFADDISKIAISTSVDYKTFKLEFYGALNGQGEPSRPVIANPSQGMFVVVPAPYFENVGNKKISVAYSLESGYFELIEKTVYFS